MRFEAEQFLFPFAMLHQTEFDFIPSVCFFDGWGVLDCFAWWAVLRVYSFRPKRFLDITNYILLFTHWQMRLRVSCDCLASAGTSRFL